MLFAVFGANKPDDLERRLTARGADSFFRVGHGQFIVQAEGTSKELSDALGITSGESGSAIVVAIAGYFGRQPTSLWEWMRSKGAEA